MVFLFLIPFAPIFFITHKFKNYLIAHGRFLFVMYLPVPYLLFRYFYDFYHAPISIGAIFTFLLGPPSLFIYECIVAFILFLNTRK